MLAEEGEEKTFKAIKKDLVKKKWYRRFAEDESQKAELAAYDKETVFKLLDDLSEACDNLDSDTMESIAEDLRKYDFPGEIKNEMNELFTAVDDIDTDKCIEIIEKVRR